MTAFDGILVTRRNGIILYCLIDIFTVGPLCFASPQSGKYQGRVNVTATGKPCQRCNAQTPHTHDSIAAEFPDGSLEDAANYCRNPGNVHILWPWCFTMTSTRWEYCSIQDALCRKYRDILRGFECHWV